MKLCEFIASPCPWISSWTYSFQAYLDYDDSRLFAFDTSNWLFRESPKLESSRSRLNKFIGNELYSFLVCKQQQWSIVSVYVWCYFLLLKSLSTSFWKIALPVMAFIIPLFLWSDIMRMVHYLQKRWAVRRVFRVSCLLNGNSSIDLN